MNDIQKKLPPGEIIVYLDDTIIPSVDIQQGLDRLERFLQAMVAVGLTLRLDKCVFLSENIKFLGHNVGEHGIQPGNEKVSAIRNFPPPKDVHQARQFLGLTGFFRKFVKDYSFIAKPLTNLLKMKSNPLFTWSNTEIAAFNELKEKLCCDPILCIYDTKKRHEVHTDASSVGLAGVLMQEEADGLFKPVFNYSRHCSDPESRYYSYELEVLAIVESLERFRVYLLGKPFRVITDCSAVTTTRISKPLVPGEKNLISNWSIVQGSRLHMSTPYEPAREVPVVTEHILRIEISETGWLVTMQQQDPKLLRIMQILRGELSSDEKQQMQTDYKLE